MRFSPSSAVFWKAPPSPGDLDTEEEDEADENIFDFCCCTSGDGLCLSALPNTLLVRICSIMTLFFTIYFVYTLFYGASNAVTTNKNNFNQSRVENIVTDLCQEYKNKKVSGNLCPALCDFHNWTVVDFHQGAAKKALRIHLNGQDVILKATKDKFSDYDQLSLDVDEDELTDKIVELVNAQVNLGWPVYYKKHLMKLLWPDYNTTQTLPQFTKADRNSLWSLLQQDEFVTLTLLPLSRVTAKVHGSCGHLYAVDTLLPFHMKGYYMGLKAKILVHLMGTLKLFFEFLNEPLQWCDVKFENLGLSAQFPKRFVIMDADMLYTQSRLNEILTSRSCQTDEDCKFFDCHGTCNNGTNLCSERVNDNIDVFCEKLVKRLFGTYWSKSNRYLSACHDTSGNREKRLNELRLVWSWSLSDV